MSPVLKKDKTSLDGSSPVTIQFSNQKIPQRPGILKPVQPPKKRDGSQYSGSDGRNYNDLGYMSQASAGLFGYTTQGVGSDNESARMSNLNTFKYNGV